MDDEPSCYLELSFSAENLPNLDRLSKTDAQVRVETETTPRSGTFAPLWQSEVVKNSLAPTFTTALAIRYFFERVQLLRICVVDEDGKKVEEVGEVTVSLAQIVAAPDCHYTAPLYKRSDVDHKKQRGSISIRAEEQSDISSRVDFVLAARKLDNMDGFLSKSDPFVIIKRLAESGAWVPVVKSTVIKNNLNPKWPTLTTALGRVCGGDLDRPIMFDVYDYDRDGTHDLIGSTAQTSLRALMAAAAVTELQLSRQKKNKVKQSGYLRIEQPPKLTKVHSFFDYLKGGLEVSLHVAVDFTASNGKPSASTSLHYLNPLTPNQYARAISETGAVLEAYDHDGSVPAYGFGAKLSDGRVSHCFPLNGEAGGECAGIKGVLDAYQGALSTVKLFGPTLFHNVILETVKRVADESAGKPLAYSILLILTDGVLNDMSETVAAVRTASRLPMSIIIVGIGNADFTAMQELDDLVGGPGDRDIVQFVPFNKVRGDGVQLAREVLAEVPQQVLEHMRRHNVNPISSSDPPAYE
mmetsp:Transcript_12010/g.38183  ORF Transcript_12010/g.38183 Transcript_12010/m.38183 type:complete len:525 (-) Transcript_12010:314-1888(-)